MNTTELLTAMGTILSFSTAMITIVFLFRMVTLTRNEKRRNEAWQGRDEDRRAILESLRSEYEQEIYRIVRKMTASPGRFEDVNRLIISGTRPEVETRADEEPSIDRYLRSLGIDQSERYVDPRRIVVLMPLHEEFNGTYEVLRTIGHKLGLAVRRSDEMQVSGSLLSAIVRDIVSSRVVIALLDGRNPNVFYELGIAHALGKPTILLSSSVGEVPFDVASSRLLLFSDSKELDQKLTIELAKAFIEPGPETSNSQ